MSTRELGKLESFIFILFLVGMILGIGVLTFDKFSDASATNTYVNEDSFTWVNNTNITLNFTDITTFTGVWNLTDYLDSSYYNSDAVISDSILQLNEPNGSQPCSNGTICYAEYYYDDVNVKVQTVMNGTVDAVSPIASDWMPLLVTVFILTIILSLIIFSFGRNR